MLQYTKAILFFILIINANFLHAQCFQDRHSTVKSDAWETCTTATNPNTNYGNSQWIVYDLGAEYTLSTINFWNYNVPEELNKGVQSMIVDYSLNNNNWNHLDTVYVPQASGSNYYEGEEIASFQKQRVRYVLFTFLENWGSDECVGFSELKIKISDSRPAFVLSLVNAVCDGINTKITMNWSTEYELNSERFEIERSADGNDWKMIGSVDGRGTTESSSRYKYVDTKYKSGTNYYRLKHYDYDDNILYSDPVSVTCYQLIRVEIFPNPMVHNVTIGITSEIKEYLDYTITDPFGKVMIEGVFIAQKGYSELSLKNMNLISGNYIININSETTSYSYPLVVIE